MLPVPADILAAAHRLRGVIARTPLARSEGLSAAAGTDVYVKYENEQRTGSFKFRGAYNALVSLPDEVRVRGVVASSAGNHGLGVALAAQLLGIRARIFLPCTAPAVKRDGILALGADVDTASAHYDAAHDAAMADAIANGKTFVNPCAGATLLAGQGTVALEILEDLPAVRTLVVPVGGGGLIGGMAALVRAAAPDVQIVGAQSERTNAMAASLQAGRRVDVTVTPTLADGLAGQIDDEGFATGQFAIDAMRVVTEVQIAEAIAWMASVHDSRVEGSGACGVAAVLSERAGEWNGPIAIVVTGGNIDDARWRAITEGAYPSLH